MVKRIYYESAYGRSLSHAERDDHKYAYKKMVNGKWRYYYDDDDKPDKGLSLKKFDRRTMEIRGGYGAPGLKKMVEYNEKYQGIRPKGSKNKPGTYQEVDKDVYENSKARLYYKNEPVKNIAKRKVDETKEAVGKTIKKAGDKAKDAFGVDERERFKKAEKNYLNKAYGAKSSSNADTQLAAAMANRDSAIKYNSPNKLQASKKVAEISKARREYEAAKKDYKRKPIAITDKVSEVSRDAIESGKKIVDGLFNRKRKKR